MSSSFDVVCTINSFLNYDSSAANSVIAKSNSVIRLKQFLVVFLLSRHILEVNIYTLTFHVMRIDMHENYGKIISLF